MSTKLKQILKTHGLLIVFCVYSFIIGFIIIYFGFIQKSELNWQSSVNHRVGPTGYRLLDGVEVPRDKAALRPYAVLIENHVDSRPAAGLEYASIVYETIVEGDITRYLAIFDPSANIKKIGPVRSARPFFITIAQQWNSILFHAGGSEEALTTLKRGILDHVNEISGDGIYFWRDYQRSAPHNLFTSSDLIARAITAKDFSSASSFKPWLFKGDNRAATSTDQEIKVHLSPNDDYNVTYKYNFRTNGYLRELGGKPQKSDRGIILQAKNVIVEHVKHLVIDDYGRLNINVTGGGKAEIYLDGHQINGTWESVSGQIRYFDEDHNQLSLNRGATWVELVF